VIQIRILDGLPVYGEPVLSFPQPNAFREGLVVEFATDSGRWVGNFASGPTDGFQAIHAEFGAQDIFVFSSGSGYVIDADSRVLVAELGFGFTWVEFVGELGLLLASNDLWFEAYVGKQLKWRTRRLSWDGMRSIRRSGAVLTAEGHRIDETWHPLTVNLNTGETVGGGYDGPDA